MAKAEVIQLVGDAITTFSEIQCLTPRYSVVTNALCSSSLDISQMLTVIRVYLPLERLEAN